MCVTKSGCTVILSRGVVSASWQLEADEADHIWETLIRRDRNRPSVLWWCMGNEALPSEEQIAHYTAKAHALDATRPVLTSSPGEMVYPDGDRFDTPVLHELRRCGASYIDTSLKEKYQGALRPWRMMFAEREAARSGLDAMLPEFTRNTQRLQERCRKIIIESVRLDAHMQGYQLATFRDCGSFTWGVVDDFFGEKPGAPVSAVRQYTGETVLLWDLPWHLRLCQYGPGFQQKLPITILCSHYGEEPLNDACLTWNLTDDHGVVIDSGERRGLCCARGVVTPCERTGWKYPADGPAKRLHLRATLTAGDRSWDNAWDVWFHPKPSFARSSCRVVLGPMEYYFREYLKSNWSFVEERPDQLAADDVLVTQTVDSLLVGHLERGGRALLNGKGIFDGVVTEWCAGRSEYPRGTIVAEHPLMSETLCEGWCDVPFAPALGRQNEINGLANTMGYAVGLHDWPKDLKPIIAGIPSYKAEDPELYGHLFEVWVGEGRLLVSTLEFGSPHSLNSFGGYFLDKMLRYVCGDDFSPDVRVTSSFIASYCHGGHVQQAASQEAAGFLGTGVDDVEFKLKGRGSHAR